MDAEQAKDILDKLAKGELKEYRITKNEFLDFREVLVKREDFKHFRGNAQHNGEVIYTYLEKARS